MNPFRYDGPVMLAISKIGNLILLNLCYVLICLPIFTIGAATSALYAVYTTPHDETWCLTKFFRAFRRDFRQGTFLFLAFLAAGFLLLLSFYCLATYDIYGETAIYILLYVVSAIYCATLAFAFALNSRYENTFRQTLKNAFLLAIQMLPFSLLLAVLTALPVLFLMLDIELLLHSFLFWLAAGFAVCVKLNTLVINRVFKKVEEQTAHHPDDPSSIS